MASTATSSLKLEKQGTTDNPGAWGPRLNTGLDIVDVAVAGTYEVATTGGTTTLGDVDYTADAAKYAILWVTGTLVSNASIVVPSLSRKYVIRNATSGAYSVTIKTSAGSGVVVAQGRNETVLVDADADDVVHLDNLRADLASAANGAGASLVAIEDSGGIIAATTVEGALAENRSAIDVIEADYLTSSAIGVSVQAYDADLTTWAGLSPSANAQSLVTAADYAAMRALLDLEAGTDFYSISATDTAISGAITAAIGVSVQAYAANLTTWAGLAPSANAQSLVTAADYAAMRALLDLEAGTDVQAYDASLADISGITYAQGDVLYYNGTNLVALSPGTIGQVLQTQGAGANPQWASAGAGDVTAASAFGTDNRLVRSDGTGKGVQATGITVDDTDNVSGVETLTVADSVVHAGDTNNKIAFGTDTQSFETGGTSRLDLSDSGMRLGAANARVTTVLDEDNMASDSATALATQQSIKAYVDANAGGARIGEVIDWPLATPPSYALSCDGSAVSRATYSALYAIVGTAYGVGDGSTTFNLPDRRGQFIRGWSNGSSNDPDRASRTNRGDGTTGDNVGTKQSYEIQSHTHNTYRDQLGESGTLRFVVQNTTSQAATTATGGNETRPRNVYTHYCIVFE